MIRTRLLALALIFASASVLASCQSAQQLNPTSQSAPQASPPSSLPQASPSPTIIGAEATTLPSPTTQLSPTPLERLASQTLWSPDETLVARLYSEYQHPSGFQTIEISSREGTLLWSIPYKDQPKDVDPRPNLAIAGWSPDDDSLFFYNSFFYDGALTLWNGFNLRGIDITSGRIATLIPSDGLMAFRFSPDFTRLAYVLDEDDPRTLYIRTLASGEVRNFGTTVPRHDSGAYTQMGSIRWSDTGNRLIAFTGTTDERAAMFLFDLTHASARRLLDFWQEQYEVDDWSADDTVRLLNVFEGRIETMNLVTGELTVLGTPTPRP